MNPKETEDDNRIHLKKEVDKVKPPRVLSHTLFYSNKNKQVQTFIELSWEDNPPIKLIRTLR